MTAARERECKEHAAAKHLSIGQELRASVRQLQSRSEKLEEELGRAKGALQSARLRSAKLEKEAEALSSTTTQRL